ncbi:MAG: hypothetical protein ACR2G4_06030 [Pyrinomonadaceae bacterium]
MVDKRSKYDTDPLDPGFVRRTEEFDAETRATARTANEQARLNPEAEAPTRRIDDPLSQPYPSIFVPPAAPQPPAYQQRTYPSPPVSNFGQTTALPGQMPPPPSSRTIAGLGIPEKFALVLPYVPFYIGIVGSIIELFLVPRGETRVRFHAAQGLALQLVILAIAFALKLLGGLAGSGFGGTLFWLASNIFLIVSVIRVWKGQTHYLTPLDDATRWLYERIEPKK